MDISRITDYLYVSGWPNGGDAADLKALDIRLIVSMTWRSPDQSLRQPPLRLLRIRTLDTPLTPIPLSALQTGVEAALPVIQNGSAVLTHCRHGRHRSVAMAAAILIGTGFTAVEAMALIRKRRPVADPYIFYIRQRIRIFETWWREFRQAGAATP
jgi:protein-tyrosine phosphatase